MRFTQYLIVAMLGLAAVTCTSCRYPQPVFSLHNSEYRIIGSWQIGHTYLNGTEIDSTHSSAIEATGSLANNIGTFYYIYADYVMQVMVYYNGDVRYSTTGNWYFQNNYKDLVISFHILGKKYQYVAAVQKLSRKELIYEYDDEDGNHWRIEMFSRSSY